MPDEEVLATIPGTLTDPDIISSFTLSDEQFTTLIDQFNKLSDLSHVLINRAEILVLIGITIISFIIFALLTRRKS